MGNMPKNSRQYGNGFQSVKRPNVASGSGHGATNSKQNKTVTRGNGGISQAVGSVK